MILIPECDNIRTLSDDLFFVEIDDKWGIMNFSKEMVCEPIFDNTSKREDVNLCCVFVKDNMGYINLNGEIVYEPQFEGVHDETAEGYTIVEYKSRKTPLKKKASKAKKDK